MWKIDQLSSGLLTDLYHVDSAYVSWRTGHNEIALFDLFTRSLPFGSGYLLVAGLELAATFAREFHYRDEEIAYLQQVRPYEQAFFEDLRKTRFTGELKAIPEGEIAFANEPLIRVTAPFREALLLEAGLLHTVSVSTLLATKAARVVSAAGEKPVAEFAFRRAQEPFITARSAYIGGCASTSFLAAANQFGIPVSGTIPHALVQAFTSEEAAFRAVAESLDNYTLLLDTYDVHRAIETAIDVAKECEPSTDHRMVGVRLDSGDILADSIYVRKLLDEAGLQNVRILASGDMDEFKIARLESTGAPIDAYGVGTSIGVGAGSIEQQVDGGALGAVYKLVSYGVGGNGARIKVAGQKSTWPGAKQVSRLDRFAGDVIHLADERPPAGSRQLLQTVLSGGLTAARSSPTLNEIRERAAASLAELPEQYKRIEGAEAYPVRRSERLVALRQRTMAEVEDDSAY
ncbi:MAG: nicotinate phosphoribosyltransferase [Thermomicrobiales bacterium]